MASPSKVDTSDDESLEYAGGTGLTRSKKLLRAKGIATRNKNATRNKCIASSNKCLTSSNKKLLETSATLVVTGALLVVTRGY